MAVEEKGREEVRQVQVQRPKRVKLTPEESLKRMQEFEEKRKDAMIAFIRKDEN